MTAQVIPIPTERANAVKASVNARAAYLQVSDDIRRKWVGKALSALSEGSSAGWAISEAIRGMTSDHLVAKR